MVVTHQSWFPHVDSLCCGCMGCVLISRKYTLEVLRGVRERDRKRETNEKGHLLEKLLSNDSEKKGLNCTCDFSISL